VNGVSTVNVIHEASVDALKKAGKVVTLVRRVLFYQIFCNMQFTHLLNFAAVVFFWYEESYAAVGTFFV